MTGELACSASWLARGAALQGFSECLVSVSVTDRRVSRLSNVSDTSTV